MKYQLILLICLGLISFSCKKKVSNKTGNSGVQISFSLKKDGVFYFSNNITVGLVDSNTIMLEVYPYSGQVANNAYGAMIRRNVLPGTYSIVEGESNEFYLLHIQDTNTMFGPDTGTFTVISNDTINKIMHATFELTMYNDEVDLYPNITEGEFTIRYY